MSNSVKSAFSDEQLANMPETERAIFKNYKLIPIELIVKADWNYKLEDENTSEKLRNGLARIGQVENIHVRKIDAGMYEVVNGNHRLDELLKLNKKFVVAYDHGDISVEEAKRIAVETNETKFGADPAKLAMLLNEIKVVFDNEELMTTLPYTPEELENILTGISNSNNRELENIRGDEDNFEANAPTRILSQTGDIYHLGNHRLMCGDSTKSNDVALLMNGEKAHLLFTDPPYNVSYAEFNRDRAGGQGRDWTEEYCSDWNDEMSDSDYVQFLIDFLKNAKENLISYAHYYIFYASKYHTELIHALRSNDISFEGVPLIWAKQVAPITWANYRKKYEPFIFAGKDCVIGNNPNSRWFGPPMDDNVWQIDRDHNVNYVHPTQKPIAVIARALRNSTQENDIVLDLFGGSGSTMIASEGMNRQARLMEMEPVFCDVIVKRYIKYCRDNQKEILLKKNGVEIEATLFDE
jgi:DNA modification methylase